MGSHISVLFVCLGNICRSPTAEGVFRTQIEQRGLTHRFDVDSAGTAAWHIGKAPDPRTIKAASKRGYDVSMLRARQAHVDDFERFDYILAMDSDNLHELEKLCPDDYPGYLGLFLSFADEAPKDVPDPYYGGEQGFEKVIDLAEQACCGLLQHIQEHRSC